MSKDKRTNGTALSRLRQDYMRLKKDPVPYIVAEPLQNNILEWHYLVRGPENSPYEGMNFTSVNVYYFVTFKISCTQIFIIIHTGGIYHGKLKFPPEFPFRAPSIYMITPSGRWENWPIDQYNFKLHINQFILLTMLQCNRLNNV